MLVADNIRAKLSAGSLSLDQVPNGKLCRTDSLHEGLLSLIAHRPAVLLQLALWLAKGKSAFKRQVADHSILDPVLQPYDDNVLELLRQARAEGRKVALVSAADYRQVEAVAAHLGLFDVVVSTGSPGVEENLRGKAKADFLVGKFGVRGFDYLGDSATDLPVWKVARHPHNSRISLLPPPSPPHNTRHDPSRINVAQLERDV